VRALKHARVSGRYIDAIALASCGRPPSLTSRERAELGELLERYRESEAPSVLIQRLEFELDRTAFLERLANPEDWSWILPQFAMRARVSLRHQESDLLHWFINPLGRTDSCAYFAYHDDAEGTVGSPSVPRAEQVAAPSVRALLGHERLLVDGQEAIGRLEFGRTAALGTNYLSPAAIPAANRALVSAFPRRPDRLLSEWRRTFTTSLHSYLDRAGTLDPEDSVSWLAEMERSAAPRFERALRVARRTLTRIVQLRETAAKHGHGVITSDGFGA
jgi:hypothetical protein